MGVAAAAIIGGLALGAFGAKKGADAAEATQDELAKIAKTAGIDTRGLTREALTDLLDNMGLSERVSGEVSRIDQEQLMAREEMGLPGIGATRKKALGRISSMFEEDADWLRGVQRRGAALGLSSGLFGSQAGQMQTLRLSDRESMARTQLGTGLLSALIGSNPVAKTEGVRNFLGLTPSQLIGTRAAEREQRMNILAKRAAGPSAGSVWGSFLQQTGGMLAGAGVMGASGGGFGGGGGGATPGAGQQNMMMQDATGLSNMGAYYS